jgi:hypothetical protein
MGVDDRSEGTNCLIADKSSDNIYKFKVFVVNAAYFFISGRTSPGNAFVIR